MNLEELKFIVEDGDEHWDYDVPDGMPPISFVINYKVKIGNLIIKTTSNKKKANYFARIMNQALDNANKKQS